MVTSLHTRLRKLVAALPSDDSSVTFTRAALLRMLEEDDLGEPEVITRDLRVSEVAEETCRAPSTVRSWLISGHLWGYKLQGRDWRVPRSALRAFLDAQPSQDDGLVEDADAAEVDIGAWRALRNPRES